MAVEHLLQQQINYQTERTALGWWRRFLYPDGELFEEFVSHARFAGLPLLHFTRGRCPETGRRIVARGVIAVGRLAVGGLAIGQASLGLVAVGQLGLGLLFGLGQATSGVVALGQLALGFWLGIGQLATGYIAVGQLAAGHYVLAQRGFGTEVWDMRHAAPAAQEFFGPWLDWLRNLSNA